MDKENLDGLDNMLEMEEELNAKAPRPKVFNSLFEFSPSLQNVPKSLKGHSVRFLDNEGGRDKEGISPLGHSGFYTPGFKPERMELTLAKRKRKRSSMENIARSKK